MNFEIVSASLKPISKTRRRPLYLYPIDAFLKQDNVAEFSRRVSDEELFDLDQYELKRYLFKAVKYDCVFMTMYLLAKLKENDKTRETLFFNYRNKNNETLLHIVSRCNHTNICKILLSYVTRESESKFHFLRETCDSKKNAFTATALNGSFELAKLIMNKLKEIETSEEEILRIIRQKNCWGMSALEASLLYEFPRTLELLLENGESAADHFDSLSTKDIMEKFEKNYPLIYPILVNEFGIFSCLFLSTFLFF